MLVGPAQASECGETSFLPWFYECDTGTCQIQNPKYSTLGHLVGTLGHLVGLLFIRPTDQPTYRCSTNVQD